MGSISGDPKRRSSAPKGRQPDRWGVRAGGRLFVTSLSLLTREFYHRSLSLYQPCDSDPLADPKPADERTPAERTASRLGRIPAALVAVPANT